MFNIIKSYVYYIELLVSIENDQDLVKFINTKVKSSTISFCANYNQARNETNVRIL